MSDFREVRRDLRALPGAEATGARPGLISWKVGGKMFATAGAGRTTAFRSRHRTPKQPRC
jgi:hypothetical protein